LINLMTGMIPWHAAEASDRRWNSFMADPDFLREILPISRPLNELLTRCFRTSPSRRPTLTQLRHEVLAMPELFMSDADLQKAPPGVRRVAQCEVPSATAFDPSDYSIGSEASTSGSGYSSLDAHIGGPVNFPAPTPAPAAAAASGSRLIVPLPASIPSATKVPFASRADLSSVVESDGPLTPQAHLVHLPPVSSDQQQPNVPVLGKTPPGKFKRFMRRLRVWRKLWYVSRSPLLHLWILTSASDRKERKAQRR
jgi:serine/threonine protein kinase